jgi:hypothetical protein
VVGVGDGVGGDVGTGQANALHDRCCVGRSQIVPDRCTCRVRYWVPLPQLNVHSLYMRQSPSMHQLGVGCRVKRSLCGAMAAPWNGVGRGVFVGAAVGAALDGTPVGAAVGVGTAVGFRVAEGIVTMCGAMVTMGNPPRGVGWALTVSIVCSGVGIDVAGVGTGVGTGVGSRVW